MAYSEHYNQPQNPSYYFFKAQKIYNEKQKLKHLKGLKQSSNIFWS